MSSAVYNTAAQEDLEYPLSNIAVQKLSLAFFKSCLCNVSIVLLTDDGPLSSFQERSSSASSFYTSLLQAIDGVMSLALCPLVASQAPQ